MDPRRPVYSITVGIRVQRIMPPPQQGMPPRIEGTINAEEAAEDETPAAAYKRVLERLAPMLKAAGCEETLVIVPRLPS